MFGGIRIGNFGLKAEAHNLMENGSKKAFESKKQHIVKSNVEICNR
jgi:hypothetical protein